ncbi:MAG: hypothetical protein C5B46_07750 [Proteobacteria bacterium]|nr:MAG: hypothetical protein C5B46_07750 [Pseudomonadota bacterium]
MNRLRDPNPPVLAQSLSAQVSALLARDSGRTRARWHSPRASVDLTLASHFQPILSLAHSRTVGYEALMRAFTARGDQVNPLDVFAGTTDFLSTLQLEWLSRAVHFENFIQHGNHVGWLFLNTHPRVFVEGARHAESMEGLFLQYGLPASRVVLEVLEHTVTDEARLRDAVSFYRDLGCLIAIDDFGAGHSNFNRVWSLRPEIVKLDRSMVSLAATDPILRRTMPVLVSLLHEAGSMVLMEGIETEDEAMLAMDADADFVQGYYFARPAETLPEDDSFDEMFEHLWSEFRETVDRDALAYREQILPYMNALGACASRVQVGTNFEEACQGFLALEHAQRCYMLDRNGRQASPNFRAPATSDKRSNRFAPVDDAQGANWSRRFYFRRALEHPGRVQVTRPYLSITSASPCVTVSSSVVVHGETRVLCGDVAWCERAK